MLLALLNAYTAERANTANRANTADTNTVDTANTADNTVETADTTNASNTAEDDKMWLLQPELLAQSTRLAFILLSGACSSLRMGLMWQSGNETVVILVQLWFPGVWWLFFLQARSGFAEKPKTRRKRANSVKARSRRAESLVQTQPDLRAKFYSKVCCVFVFVCVCVCLA